MKPTTPFIALACLYTFNHNQPNATCDEHHRIKMPYIPYHRFVSQPWQHELRERLATICLNLSEGQKLKAFDKYQSGAQVQQAFDSYCKEHKSCVAVGIESYDQMMYQLRGKAFVKRQLERQFEQIQALLNAAIYNERLRGELVERPEFWEALTDIQSIMDAEVEMVPDQAASKKKYPKIERSMIEGMQELVAQLFATLSLELTIYIKQLIFNFINSFKIEEILLKMPTFMKLHNAFEKFASAKTTTLRKINAQKCLHNLRVNKRNDFPLYGHAVLPISDNCFVTDPEVLKRMDIDLVFIQGQDSHPLRTWYTARGSDKIWPQEFLKKEDLQGREARIFLVRYDSKRLEREHFIFNIPDHEIEGLSSEIYQDLLKAGIGQRPFMLIPYSLGGIVTRNLIVDSQKYKQSQGQEQFMKNLRGVAFIAAPLHGTTMRHQINEDLKCLISSFNKALGPIDMLSIKDTEYVHHFLENGFPLSKMTIHVDTRFDFHSQNQTFLDLGIPYICLIESEETYFPTAGKRYFFVSKECAILDPAQTDKNFVIEGKTHGMVQQVKDKSDPTYKVLRDFILQSLNVKP